MPKLTNPTKKQLREKLDGLQAAHTRSYGRCEKCGVRTGLTNSHIIGRTYIKTQFDPRNLQCLCGSCHGYFTHNPIAFAEWVSQTTCGLYIDVMQRQALSTIVKPSYDVWLEVRTIIDENRLGLEDARQWLGQKILWSIRDIPELAMP